jgi:hypothetical protein
MEAAGREWRGIVVEYVSPLFSWPDALILYTILMHAEKGGATLYNIIVVHDYVDRSYPTAEQLEGALNRFLAAGLIAVEEARYLATELAVAEFADCTKVGLRIQRNVEAIEKKLGSLYQPELCPRVVMVDENTLQETIRRYIKEF